LVEDEILILLFSGKFGTDKFPVHPRDVGTGNEFGTFCFARVSVGAIAKAQFVHLPDHFSDTLFGFDFSLRKERQLGYFG
jgi:hypothetical protein